MTISVRYVIVQLPEAGFVLTKSAGHLHRKVDSVLVGV